WMRRSAWRTVMIIVSSGASKSNPHIFMPTSEILIRMAIECDVLVVGAGTSTYSSDIKFNTSMP
ncbi:MAG: hypothetical protein L6408_04345, partial [Nanoarchaeota archaeon]|nr:hypothetical protein [Nanoarchaeota archaeon]